MNSFLNRSELIKKELENRLTNVKLLADISGEDKDSYERLNMEASFFIHTIKLHPEFNYIYSAMLQYESVNANEIMDTDIQRESTAKTEKYNNFFKGYGYANKLEKLYIENQEPWYVQVAKTNNQYQPTIKKKELLFYLTKLYLDITSRIDTDISKEIIIEKFISYMELYFDRKDDLIKKTRKLEAYFKNEFHKYLHLNGFFPLSEIQVNNGRIDGLVNSIDFDYSFIYEAKQLGFDKVTVTTKKVNDTINDAKKQILNYYNRLKTYKTIKPVGHILIFTGQSIDIKDVNLVEADIQIHIHKIELSDLPPSTKRKLNE